MIKLNIIIEESNDGYFAYCPELEGCMTQGDDLDEVKVNINDAIELYLSTLDYEEIFKLKNRHLTTFVQEFDYV